MNLSNIGIGFAFLAGLASFLSPCVFSLVPAYIGYLGGRSAASAQGGRANHLVTFSHGATFVLGFSLVFISLGLTASALGGLMYDSRVWLARIGGVIVIVFGLHMTGIFRIPFLEYDLRPQSMPDRKRGYLASLLMGVFFSAGWSPCVGPILGSILTVSAAGGSIAQGLILLTAYSAGLAIPFLIASVQIGLVTVALRKYGKAMHYVEVGMGIILVLVGALLLSGRLARVAQLGTSFFGFYNEVLLGQYLLVAVVALLILGLIPAYLANRRGRNFWTWWMFGVSLFPVSMIAVLLTPEKAAASIETVAEDNPDANQSIS